jgi:hypothetical protein
MRIQAGIDPATMKDIVVRLKINQAKEDGTFAGEEVYFRGLNENETIEDIHGTGFVKAEILPSFLRTFPDLENAFPFSYRELKDCFDPVTSANNDPSLPGAIAGLLRRRIKPFLDDLGDLDADKVDLFKTYYILSSLEKFYRDKITREPGNGMRIGSLRAKAEEYEKGITGASGGIVLGDKSPAGVEKRLRQLYLDGNDSRNESGIKTLPYLFVLGRLERVTKHIATLSEKFPTTERQAVFEAMHAYLFLKDSVKKGELSDTRKIMVGLMKDGKYDEAKQVGDTYNLNISEERRNQVPARRR